MPKKSHFSPKLFKFVRDLEKNNDRDWFNANKSRYEDHVKEPALEFISDFGPKLQKISPHFDAIPKAVGGSLFRIYRDVRFSKDKSPYKTHVGIHFRHKKHKTAHAPGFYLHLEPGGCFVGAGIWRPDGPTLRGIRERIAKDPKGWNKVISAKALSNRGLALGGDALKRPPKGFDPDHPAIEDLKRKDFILVSEIKQSDVTQPGYIDEFAKSCKAAAPLVAFLCKAGGVRF